ncbi:hypothetical protein TrVE_jg4800 [Triparma verrucosa]|uniref:Uncharacterized protein n=1 Tax=Triparma verrucosa TaxID=1606542 RepID=A0A9W7BKR5_9STRA|nr:hypothetical protein TrVE_jg4800 [Triparma verrucosa]
MKNALLFSLALLCLARLPRSDGLVAPSAKLLDLQAKLLSKVSDAMPLQKTDHCEVVGGDKHKFGGSAWYSEESPNFLTGVSVYQRKATVGVDVWMGPSYDVPHSLLRIEEYEGDKFNVMCDMVPRGATPIGSDPSQLEKYYGDDRIQWHKGASKLAGAVQLPASSSFYKRVVSSPMLLQIGGLEFEDAERLATEHQDFFVASASAAQQIPARLRGSFNLRDDKIRQFFYRGEVEENVEEFGADLGSVIAAAQTGPVAEAYVGGGS